VQEPDARRVDGREDDRVHDEQRADLQRGGGDVLAEPAVERRGEDGERAEDRLDERGGRVEDEEGDRRPDGLARQVWQGRHPVL
jgi:hypothetical protein